MASKKCSKKITINGTKVAFKHIKAYAYDDTGALVRIRSKKQIPSDPSGQAVITWASADTDGDPHSNPSGPWREGTTRARRQRPNRAVTGEGGYGHKRTPLDELDVLASTFRAGHTAYETADDRAARLRSLAATCATAHPGELLGLVTTLRRDKGVRTPAIVIAVEAAIAGHPDAYQLLRTAIARPDEPGLALQYAMETHGRIPNAVRRAAGDAAVELYTEETTLRYDRRRTRRVAGDTGTVNGFRFSDVIRLTHARPTSPAQQALFAHLTVDATVDAQLLPTLAAVTTLRTADPDARRGGYGTAVTWARQVFTGQTDPRTLPDDPIARAVIVGGVDLALQHAPRDPAADQAVVDAEAAVADAKARLDELADSRRTVRLVRNALRRAETKARWGRDVDETTRACRQEKLDQLRTQAAELAPVERDIYRAGIALRDAQWQLTEAKDSRATTGRGTAIEASLPTMSDRGLLMRVTDLASPDVSDEARTYAKTRIATALTNPDATTSLSDVVRTAKAVAELETKTRTAATGNDDEDDAYGYSTGWYDPYTPRTSWTQVTTEWDDPINQAVTACVADRLEPLTGKRVLVLVDGSGSMWSEVSTRQGDKRSETYSGLRRDEVAAFIAAAIAAQPGAVVDVVAYDTEGTPVDVTGDGNVLAATRAIAAACRGGGTDTLTVTDEHWDDHDIVITLTDEQVAYGASRWGGRSTRPAPTGSPFRRVPDHVQMVTCNLAGDEAADRAASPNRVTVAGMSDILFDEIAAAGRRVTPTETR